MADNFRWIVYFDRYGALHELCVLDKRSALDYLDNDPNALWVEKVDGWFKRRIRRRASVPAWQCVLVLVVLL